MTTAIARSPGRAWPLPVVLGVPIGVLFGFSVIVNRFLGVERLGSLLAALGALPLMIIGCYLLAIPPRSPGRGARYLALAAAAIVVGFVWDLFRPDNRTPSGWTSQLPRYPGVLIEAEPCSETSGGAIFRTHRARRRGELPHTVTYESALHDAELPSSRFQATCPALGIDCMVYRAATFEILECYSDGSKSVAHVRYGAKVCSTP